MKIALVFSSKAGMQASLLHRRENARDEDDEPPPDMLAECDSDETIEAVQRALQQRDQVLPIEADERAYARLRRARPNLVFNMSEGLFGASREAQIPTMCEILGLPYTGSDPLTLGICLDKSRAKEILTYHRVANAPFWIASDPADLPASVPLPAVVKPLFEGSSKGIKDNCLVRSRAELLVRTAEIVRAYEQPVIVEKFLSGREFTVGVLGNAPRREVLPIVEIDHSALPAGAAPIYSYEAKWVWDTPENPLSIFQCPAALSDGLKRRIEEVVLRACDVLRIRDWCRIDVRLDERGEPNIIEVNPLPGVLPNPEDNSCLPKAARAAGYSYAQLLHRVVDEACRRQGLRRKPRPAGRREEAVHADSR